MMEKRTHIIRKIADILKNQTVAGETIFINRIIPLQPRLFPAIMIFSPREKIDNSKYQNYLAHQSTMTVVIEGAITTRNYEDVDSFSGQVKKAVLDEPTLDNLVKNIELVDVEFDIVRQGQCPFYFFVHEYEVTYTELLPQKEDPFFTPNTINSSFQ